MTIIKNPNGTYSVWSGIVNNFTYINISKEFYIKIILEECKNNLNKVFEKVDKGIKHGIGIEYTLEERLEIIEKVHGKERRKEVEKLLNKVK